MNIVVDKYNALPISKGGIIAIFCVIALLIITLYLLRSLGVYKLAKNKDISCSVLAFIPGLWVYPLCKVVGDSRFFSTRLSKIAVFFTIAVVIINVLSIVDNVLSYFPLVGYYFQNGEIYFSNFETTISGYELYPLSSNYIYVKNIVFPYDVRTIIILHNVIYYVTGILDLFVILCNVYMYIAVFKSYTPSSYILFSILSILGLAPIFLFVIRNKKQVNFSDYVRSRYYGSVNNTNNFETPPENPFSEFSDKKEYDQGDPFSEFNDRDHKDDN